ncbi:MAG TPA: T9SS type A sorting domain-containing protein [Bacteroidales bacterium]|nr:T9SS type A sorting domain-containing protein [Bacteroidales bacterium]
MKIRFCLLFVVFTMTINAQTKLTISGQTYTNSEDTWLGVNIARDQPTTLVFKNNSITSVNRYGYLLQAGDEGAASTNNNLDGAVITGNRLSWSGSDMTVIPHGLFTGHNRNVVAKYNYLKDVPMGIIRKSSNNMVNTGGGVAYNIVKNGAVAMVIKGMSNVNVFNNTFYTERTPSQTWRPLLDIYTNTDNGNHSVARGTKIFNNIFYMKYQTLAITIDNAENLEGLECDYNVYWCEAGTPGFKVNGSVKTFSEWQAMGYDAHSVVMNPEFKDLVNFVPSKRLDFGRDLGAEWKDGLALNAKWGTADPATTAQNGKWQAGAVVYEAGTVTEPVQPAPPVAAPEPPVTTPATDSNNISFSANPVRNSLTVNNMPASDSGRLAIYDFSGKLCLEKPLPAAASQVVPINLGKGIYIAYVKKGDEVVHFRKLIVVQ